MKKFIDNIKKYWNYIIYQSKADIKMEFVNSQLGALWIVLEPLCFMLIYTFVAGVIFKSREQYFPVFVYMGLALWNFFNKTIISSIKLVASNRDIVTKVYVPKYILLIEKMTVNFFKLLVSLSLIIIFMIFYHVPISWNILFVIPILITLIIVTFGISSIFMHLGVFIEDLANLTNIGMRFIFYLTGIFYSIKKKIPSPYNHYLLYINPMAYLVSSNRECVLYQTLPNIKPLLIWLILGFILSAIGIKIINKYENTYAKVMKH